MIRLIVAIALFTGLPALADSWSPAVRTSYFSPDNATRLTVVPRDLESGLAYFTDKVDGKGPAGQRRDGEPRAIGILERRVGNAWTKVWQVPLVNEVAPVRALVANGGQFVVTFDNWHSVGFGNNVVVIYRGDGSLLRSMKLTDILPEDYVQVLPTSVSSRWWGGDHVLSGDGQQLVLKVVVPSRREPMDSLSRHFVNVTIDLATGTVAPIVGPAWDQAMATAAPLVARSKAAEATWRAQMIAPLVAPSGADEGGWSRYIRRAIPRLAAASPSRGLDSIWILPAQPTPKFAEQAKDVREVFTDWDEKGDLAFASPAAPEVLARILTESARTAPPRRLVGSRVFVALPAAFTEGVRTALERTGATVIMFDPAVPIPQRPEGLQKLGVASDQTETEAARAAADARRFEVDAVRLDAVAPPEPESTDKDGEGLDEMADRLEEEAAKAEAPTRP